MVGGVVGPLPPPEGRTRLVLWSGLSVRVGWQVKREPLLQVWSDSLLLYGSSSRFRAPRDGIPKFPLSARRWCA